MTDRMLHAGFRSGLIVVLLAFFCPAAMAQTQPESPEAVLGYELGEHFTDYAGIREYARTLADASPAVEYRAYGTTPERRELFQLVIARPEVHERMESVLQANAELILPGTPASRAAEVAGGNPAVVYFTYGLHGNESGSSEAALWTAYDLAREAPEVRGVLDSLVVIIDPNANPDGRERYVGWFNSVVGAEANPSPQSREHREPWPGGRFNHYLFDLNRDWAWGTQPETRARLETWSRWNPQVHVDFHEMGHNSTYFFFPATDPVNPMYPDFVLDWGRRFGEANARAFDREGWAYFTGEVFDLFYPGYGDSWPSLTGAVGMTYEQAGHGMAGRAIEREAGDTLTLRQRAEQHRTAGHATLRASAEGKTALLTGYAASQRAVGEGEPDVLLLPGDDPGRVEALVAHLRGQGIEVERAGGDFRANVEPYPGHASRRDFSAGTYRVRARQPRGRLASTLLQPETELRADFSYDISAWSLPYAYGVEAHRTMSSLRGNWTPVAEATDVPNPARAPEPGYGYLVPPGELGAAGIIQLLRGDGRVRVLTRGTTHDGRAFPAGSWFVPAADNSDLRARATEAGLGEHVVAVRGGLSEEGIDLGSNLARPVHLPAVAVLSGEGISPTSFGPTWFFLEQELGLPFDALDLRGMSGYDLSRYDVIVVPDVAGGGLNETARERLREWTEQGGRLVAYAGAAEALAPTFDIALRSTNTGGADEVDAEPDVERLLRGRLEREQEGWRERVPGTILPTRIDPAHPLAWGAGDATEAERLFVLHRGSLVFEPAESVESVAYFPADVERLSGVISDESLSRVEQGAWLVTSNAGRGSVTLFAGDPLFRMFWRTTQPLLVNAILLGPGM